MQEQEIAYSQEQPSSNNLMQQIGRTSTNKMFEAQSADNVSIFEIEQDRLYNKVKHTLLGEVWDEENEVWIKDPDLTIPLMNKQGVHYFMLKLGSHLDKNITLSDFKLEEIYDTMKDICMEINEIFWKKHQTFEIKQEDMDNIKSILVKNIFANYKRALEGGERKHRETIIRSVESIRDSQSTTQETNNGRSHGMFAWLKKGNQGGNMNGYN